MLLSSKPTHSAGRMHPKTVPALACPRSFMYLRSTCLPTVSLHEPRCPAASWSLWPQGLQRPTDRCFFLRSSCTCRALSPGLRTAVPFFPSCSAGRGIPPDCCANRLLPDAGPARYRLPVLFPKLYENPPDIPVPQPHLPRPACCQQPPGLPQPDPVRPPAGRSVSPLTPPFPSKPLPV